MSGSAVEGRSPNIGGLPPYGAARAWVIRAVADPDPRTWDWSWWAIVHCEPVRAFERVEALKAEARHIGRPWFFPLIEKHDAAAHGPLYPGWRPFPPLHPETAAIQAESAAALAAVEPLERARSFYQRMAARLSAYAASQPKFEMSPDAAAPRARRWARKALVG